LDIVFYNLQQIMKIYQTNEIQGKHPNFKSRNNQLNTNKTK